MSHHAPKETHSYKGWLNSDSFIKRSMAIFGYYTVAYLFLLLIFIVIVLFFGLIIFLVSLI